MVVRETRLTGYLQPRSITNASSLRLLLLSRMNGDAPALMTARRLDDRGQAGG